MRQKIQQQLSIVEPPVNHEHAVELATIQNIIDGHPQIIELVYADLIKGLDDPEAGREGMMTGEQVFKSLVIKQMNGFSYSGLAFHIEDSRTYRAFCGFGIADDVPSDSTFQRDVKKVTAATHEAINRIILEFAAEAGIESGRKVRTDCTVVESNIHHPTDSSLLEDSVRVLSRLTGRAVDVFGLDISFADHSRRAKKRALEILNAKSVKRQRKPYRDLYNVTERTVGYATQAAQSLELLAAMGVSDAEETAAALRGFIELAEKVMSQTGRRVFLKERVPPEDKIVSIFEPHTDIIVKDRRDTHFGHKIALTGGQSGLITDLVVEEGNPADATLAVKMVRRQKEIYNHILLVS